MYQSTPISPHANESVARTLAHAVEVSGKPRHQIARDVGMHRETLLRILRGERPIGLDEAARILTEVTGEPNPAATASLPWAMLPSTGRS